MDNLESTSDKLKIERLSDLVKSLYENIDDLKSRLDEKNITQSNKAFDELYEKHRNLEKDFATMGKSFDTMEKDYEECSEELYQANLILGEMRMRLNTSESDYRKLMDSFMQKKKWIEELRDAHLQLSKKAKKELENSKSKLSQAEETIASYKKTYETLRKENEELKLVVKYLNQHENVVFNDKHDFSYHVGNKMGELAKELEEANHLSLTMRTMYEDLYDNYRDVKVELAEWKEYMREVLVRNYDFIKAIGKLEKEKAILENNAAKHEREVNGLKCEIEQITNALLESDRDMILSNIKKRKEIVETLKKHDKEIENLTAIISGMENEMNKKDFENNELNCAVHLASYILGNHNDYPRD